MFARKRGKKNETAKLWEKEELDLTKKTTTNSARTTTSLEGLYCFSSGSKIAGRM